MKLPDTKKERIQTIILIIVGIIFVLYVSGSYAIKPLRKKRTDQLNRIEELKSKIEMVKSVIQLVKLGKQVNNDVVAELVQITETSNYVMKAQLGNYLIGATELIEKMAEEEQVALKSIRELNITDIAEANNDSNPFRLYNIRVSIECGIHDLVKLLKNIESSNPYLAISEISIIGQPAQSAEHSISFNIQWPIWKDESIINDIIQSSEEP